MEHIQRTAVAIGLPWSFSLSVTALSGFFSWFRCTLFKEGFRLKCLSEMSKTLATQQLLETTIL